MANFVADDSGSRPKEQGESKGKRGQGFGFGFGNVHGPNFLVAIMLGNDKFEV